jgi:soluble lytic murein transglycosylase
MKMPVFLARRIRVLLFRAALLLLGAGLAVWLASAATPLASLVTAYREKPSPSRRDAVLQFAAAHPKDFSGALAYLAAGAAEAENGERDAALTHLKAAVPRLASLADYIAYYSATARLGNKEYAAAIKDLDSILVGAPISPLLGNAALLAARAHMEAGAPSEAVSVLTRFVTRLPQPEGGLSLALAYEAAGQLALAATAGQQVYYDYPASKQAPAAGQLLDRLRAALGEDYPPPLPAAILGRAQKWMEARDYRRARTEFEAVAPLLGGGERELARLRAAQALCLAGNPRDADVLLKTLITESPDLDAERLYYLVRCERALGNPAEMLDYVNLIGSRYPASKWRLEALTWAGNYYVLNNDQASYLPLFRTCYESFPGEPGAAYCHWKAAWAAYMKRQAEAGQLLKDHLRMFPESEKRPAAMYYLGLLAESSADSGAARQYYRSVLDAFPNNYYAQLALHRLKLERNPAPAASSISFTPSAALRRRIERSRLLASAGLHDWADRELTFAASVEGQPHVVAVELARQTSERGATHLGVRQIKVLFPAYLSTALDAASVELWRLAFPLPYRQQLEAQARLRKLDPLLVAALIRQESEFNAGAISPAGARGLMQVMPRTGADLTRRLKLGSFSISQLHRPGRNLQLGTYYFRSLLDSLGGSVEAALAAYNAGKTNADLWLSWGPFQEPSEFVETIPFSETRTYVQAVMRNRWMYERIYTRVQGRTGVIPGAAKK